MVAVLPAEASVLCVHPAERKRALGSMEAEKQADGSYIALLGGKARRFEVFETTAPYYCSSLYRAEQPFASPITDLVAFLPDQGDHLCVHPAYTEQVLEQMGAKPDERGGHVATLPKTMNNEQAPEPTEAIHFRLKETLAPFLCALSGDDEDDEPGKDDPDGGVPSDGCGDADTDADDDTDTDTGVDPDGYLAGAPARKDGGPSEQGCDPWTFFGPRCGEEDGFPPPFWPVFHKGRYSIYKDADCNENVPAKTTCYDTSWYCPTYKYGETGSSEYRQPAHKRCARGFGFCVEVNSVPSHVDYFDNNNCTPPPKSGEDYRAPGCYVFTNENPGDQDPGDPVVENDTYRLYRNAVCVSAPRRLEECSRSDDMSKGKWVETVYKPYMHCRRGSGYCVETDSEIGTRTYYDLRNTDGKCAVPLAEEKVSSDNTCLP